MLTHEETSMPTSSKWMFDSEWWHAETSKLRRKINGLDYDTKREMTRLFAVCEEQVMAICREEITCRARNAQTDRHAQLMRKFKLSHSNLEQHVVMAQLMKQ